MVPSRVSRQWVSPRDASLPSLGSRRARFPALSGTMKALRLPARVSTVTYLVRFRSPRDPSPFVSAVALPEAGGLFRARACVPPAAPSAGSPQRGRDRDLSGLQAIRPVPLLRSRTPVEPTCPRLLGHVDVAPAGWTAKASTRCDFGANPQLRHPLPYASRVTLPHTCKARFRLAGSPWPDGSRTHWIATRGFSSC
jgi:hypothetical protein